MEDNKRKISNIWKELSPILNPNKKGPRHIINKIVHNGVTFKDGINMTEKFNLHFCKIGHNLQSSITDRGDEFKQFLPYQICNSFYLSRVNLSDLLKELNSRKI